MELRNIKKSYAQRVILNNISCHFGIGMNVIVGDSGEGKSTLLNIMGLLEKPEEGQIFLGHEEEDFRFLRDGGEYENPKSGETEYFDGHLFDEVVFNDSIEEFLKKKQQLAN